MLLPPPAGMPRPLRARRGRMRQPWGLGSTTLEFRAWRQVPAWPLPPLPTQLSSESQAQALLILVIERSAGKSHVLVTWDVFFRI